MWRVLVLTVFFVLAGCTPPKPAAFSNTDITGAAFGRSLSGLKDQNGKPQTLADFQGKAVVLFFGYTSCPDVCPTTLSRLAKVMEQLGGEAGKVQVLLVTVDPERDTPQKLGAYVTAFNSSFIGLSGDLPATEAVAKEFKVFFTKNTSGHQHHEGMGYTIDHTAGAYVFDPAGKIRLYVKDDASVDAIARDLKRLLAKT